MPLFLTMVLLAQSPLSAADPGGAPARDALPAGAEEHWAFRPPERRPPAAVADRDWPRTFVDSFVLARLEREGLAPAPAASAARLLRRLSFDLTGLPPSPAEIAAFEGDAAPDAAERLVDRLLGSPRHGERWAQHWLDVVRYAESEGFEYDRPLHGAWRYRDEVIGAFNADRPFDRFLAEQLAGDEIDPQDLELRAAAGFLRLGPVRRNAGNQEVAASRDEVLGERTDTIGAAFLGLSVGCARCHDHKFDPLSQKEYFQLQAFLASTAEEDLPLAGTAEVAAWKARHDEVAAEVAGLEKQLESAGAEAKPELRERLAAARGRLPAPLPSILSVRDAAAPLPVHVLLRGDFQQRGEAVGMRLPRFLARGEAPELALATPNPRLLLARWLTDASHPLTARVLVNRVWQHHFGLGLVRTANDFGRNGDRPSHPELLDTLARVFADDCGWRWKPLHRAVVLSAAYRQAGPAAGASAGAARDPENRLLSGFPRRRLSAEEVRDAMLAAAGSLNLQAGGESVVLPVEPELVGLLYDPKQWVATADPRQHFRRSVYLLAKRNLRLPFLEVLDQPPSQASCARREASTHALQALELLNGALANELAARFADRLRAGAGAAARERQVELAFLLAAGRRPSPGEAGAALEFLEREPLEELALAMFNLNTFIYVD
jgi:hypothetical protein